MHEKDIRICEYSTTVNDWPGIAEQTCSVNIKLEAKIPVEINHEARQVVLDRGEKVC